MWTRQHDNTQAKHPSISSSLAPSDPQQHQRLRAIRLAVVACCLLLLIGCGPERSGGSAAQLEVEAERIAAEYAGDGDVGRAVAQIEALEGVANPKQWLLLLTERYINDGEDANSIASLVKLTDALGLDSTTVSTYAKANGLFVEAEIAAEPLVVVATPIAAQQAGNARCGVGSDADQRSLVRRRKRQRIG